MTLRSVPPSLLRAQAEGGNPAQVKVAAQEVRAAPVPQQIITVETAELLSLDKTAAPAVVAPEAPMELVALAGPGVVALPEVVAGVLETVEAPTLSGAN